MEDDNYGLLNELDREVAKNKPNYIEAGKLFGTVDVRTAPPEFAEVFNGMGATALKYAIIEAHKVGNAEFLHVASIFAEVHGNEAVSEILKSMIASIKEEYDS
jgi:hypothetical protein